MPRYDQEITTHTFIAMDNHIQDSKRCRSRIHVASARPAKVLPGSRQGLDISPFTSSSFMRAFGQSRLRYVCPPRTIVNQHLLLIDIPSCRDVQPGTLPSLIIGRLRFLMAIILSACRMLNLEVAKDSLNASLLSMAVRISPVRGWIGNQGHSMTRICRRLMEHAGSCVYMSAFYVVLFISHCVTSNNDTYTKK